MICAFCVINYKRVQLCIEITNRQTDKICEICGQCPPQVETYAHSHKFELQ